MIRLGAEVVIPPHRNPFRGLCPHPVEYRDNEFYYDNNYCFIVRGGGNVATSSLNPLWGATTEEPVCVTEGTNISAIATTDPFSHFRRVLDEDAAILDTGSLFGSDLIKEMLQSGVPFALFDIEEDLHDIRVGHRYLPSVPSKADLDKLLIDNTPVHCLFRVCNCPTVIKLGIAEPKNCRCTSYNERSYEEFCRAMKSDGIAVVRGLRTGNRYSVDGVMYFFLTLKKM